jgi:hypothetical protein
MVSLAIILVIFALFSPKKILHYIIVALMAYAFPLHFLTAVLVMAGVYMVYRLLLGRLNILKKFFLK